MSVVKITDGVVNDVRVGRAIRGYHFYVDGDEMLVDEKRDVLRKSRNIGRLACAPCSKRYRLVAIAFLGSFSICAAAILVGWFVNRKAWRKKRRGKKGVGGIRENKGNGWPRRTNQKRETFAIRTARSAAWVHRLVFGRFLPTVLRLG